ncbi:MAG: alpha/beta hydrolase [Candidatus Nomurabacteria bacterium]|jgi:pimeloyl-ACP methyl ester carboxylesterase|nr:alpha/beta hydrolase [Candidatus Nomurabacteria bacterium]
MKLVVDGLMTEYTDIGKGKVLLFLHGWGSNAAAFDGLFAELKSRYRVVGLNLPGFGGSDEPKTAWDVASYANFVAEFTKKLGLENVYAIVGHSFGGRIILKGVGEGKFKAEKLVFLGSAGVKPQMSAKHRLLKLGRPFAKLPGFKNVAARMRSSDYAATNGVIREVFKKVISEDLTAYMPKIKLPCLLVWGENDTEAPISDAKIFEAKIPNSKLHILPNAGHYVFLDKSDEVADLIADFLK